jgi:undecaprenyl-diphosphatase
LTGGRIVAALAALLLVARVVRRRRGMSWWALAAAAVAAAALCAYAAGLLPPLPDLATLLSGLSSTLGPWTYLLVGVAVFLESAAFLGLLTPGELVVLLGGVVAARGEVDIVVLVGLTWLCSLLGDTTGYVLGHRLGRPFLERHGPRFRITEDRLLRVEDFFERRGGATVLVGRFVGIVRPLAPFVAGSSGMTYRRFLPYSVVGTGLWGTTFCLLGYFFYSSFARVADLAGEAGAVLALAMVVAVGGIYGWRRLRHPEERRRLRGWLVRQGRRPALRPLAWFGARVLSPVGRRSAVPLRFLGARLTPGGLGIELTSALAVAAVGLYVFGLYATIVSRAHGALTPLDRASVRVLGPVAVEPAVTVARVVTELGSLPVTAVLALAVAGWLASRGRAADACALLAGFVLVWVAVHVAKAGIDRPRPVLRLTDTWGSSYPSGHAAYGTVWVAAGVAAARALPGFKRLAGLVVAAVALTAVIGLTRVFLRAHYLSDVAGGWGLGLGIYALAAMALLVGSYLARPAAPERPPAAAATTVPPQDG